MSIEILDAFLTIFLILLSNIIWTRPTNVCNKYFYSTCFSVFYFSRTHFYVNNLYAVKFIKQSIYLIFEIRKRGTERRVLNVTPRKMTVHHLWLLGHFLERGSLLTAEGAVSPLPRVPLLGGLHSPSVNGPVISPLFLANSLKELCSRFQFQWTWAADQFPLHFFYPKHIRSDDILYHRLQFSFI